MKHPVYTTRLSTSVKIEQIVEEKLSYVIEYRSLGEKLRVLRDI